MDLKELESGVDPDRHWYYQAKKVPMFRYFSRVSRRLGRPLTLIDFGAGSGFFALELLKAFPERIEKVYLVDIGYTEEEMAESEGHKVEKCHFVPEGVKESLVLMMDVIEHIEDDLSILQDIKRRLSGSDHFFFITVPAFQDLWSSHDVFLEHYRRYTRNSLNAVLEKAGYHKQKIYYIFTLIFPLVWLIRKMSGKPGEEMPESSDMKPTPEPLNSLLRWVMQTEMKVLGALNTLAGVTCVAQGKISEAR